MYICSNVLTFNSSHVKCPILGVLLLYSVGLGLSGIKQITLYSGTLMLSGIYAENTVILQNISW